MALYLNTWVEQTSPQPPGSGISFYGSAYWVDESGYGYFYVGGYSISMVVNEGGGYVAENPYGGSTLGYTGYTYPSTGSHTYDILVTASFDIWDGFYASYDHTEWMSSSSPVYMTLANPAPTVSTLNGGTACIVGGTYNIAGANFTGATSVSIGGNGASFSVTNSTTISVTIAHNISGTTLTVSVTTSSGTGSANVGNVSTPSISISPTTAYKLAGYTQTFTAAVTNVYNTAATYYSYYGGSFSGNVWTAPTPGSNGQGYTVGAYATYNTGTSTNATVYVYYQPYGSLSSSALNVVNGTGVTLTYSTTYATSNSNTWGMSTANLSGTSVVTPASNTSTTYTLMSINPAYTAGPYQVTVTAMAATYATSLTLSNSNPLYGQTGVTITPVFGGGGTVTAKIGTSGYGGTQISAGATSGSAITLGTATATTTYYLQVTNIVSTATATTTMTVQGVSITAPTPANAYTTTGSTRTYTAGTVSGAVNTTVNWTATGGSFSPTSTASGGTTTWTAPAVGTYTIYNTAAANGTTQSSVTAYSQQGPPTVTNVNGGGAIYVGMPVNITGTNFTGATSVSVNGISVSFSVTNSTTISITVPMMSTFGSVAFSVTTPQGTGSGNYYISYPSLTVSPSSANVLAGSTQTFTFSISNLSNNSQVTWSCSGGSITSGGVWTAPTPGTNGQGYTITATAVGNTYTTGTATGYAYNAVSISNFSSSCYYIIAGQSVTLYWTGSQGTSYSVTPTLGAVGASNAAAVTPGSSQTYTFSVSNPASSTSTTLTVYVYSAPTITNNGPVLLDTNVTLTPTFSSAVAGVSVSPGSWGTWSTGSGQAISLPYNKLYTLTQAGGAGTVYATTVTQAAMPTSNISLSKARQLTTGGGTAANYDANNATIRVLAGVGGSGTSISFSQLSGKYLSTAYYW